MSIRNSRQKIKQFLTSPQFFELLAGILIIIAGLVGFSLGRASLPRQALSGLVDTSIDVVSGGEISSDYLTLPFVASVSGTTYMPISCNAANRIISENKIFFASADQAERAGYRPNQQCGKL